MAQQDQGYPTAEGLEVADLSATNDALGLIVEAFERARQQDSAGDGFEHAGVNWRAVAAEMAQIAASAKGGAA